MNNETFQLARSAYVSKTYDVALQKFTECLEDTSVEKAPGEVGLLYHQIGNCLVKLNDPNEAIHAYSQAMVDKSYDAAGSVSYNLGMVYASQGDFEDAITHFTAATQDSRYPTPYKAFIGLGNSLLKLGKSAEAGAAFRSAALDEMNPDPTKALLNLGVCFMALDRPQDAIASYESALQFDMKPATRNKLFANMGQAYVAAGKMEKAVRAFESALADKTYVFNDAANVDYQRAVASMASGNTGEVEAVSPADPAPAADAAPARQNDLSGLDVPGDGVPLQAQPLDPSQMGTMQLSETSIMREIAAAEQAGSQFFQDAEQDFQDWGQPLKKKRRHRGLKVFLIILILIVIVAGGGAFAYTQGLGIPSKQDQVNALFADPSSDVYASNIDDTKKQRIADTVVSGASVEVVGQENNLTTAEVYVKATTQQGGEVPYQISLVRDGIGWKVSSVSLSFASQQ